MGIINLCSFILLALLAYISIRFSRMIYRDYFAPIGLFLGINLASLMLYQLNLLRLTPVTIQTYTLIAVSLFSFVVGGLVASPLFVLKSKPLPKTESADSHPKDLAGLVFFYYLTAFISIAGWMYYIMIIAPPGWWSKPWVLQFQVVPYHMGYSLLLGALVPPTFVLLALARRRITLISVFVLIVSISALALIGIKSYLVIGLSTAFLAWAIGCPGRIRVKHLIILAAFMIGFMVFYNSVIDIFGSFQFTGSRFPAALSSLERPYLYIVGPWPAMSVIMADPPELVHWGQVTLAPIWKIFGPGGLGIIERVPHNLAFVSIGASNFNVYSLIGEIYREWGWLGSILGCFFLGLISTRLYITARKRQSWIGYLLSAVFSYGLLISFFAYYYRTNLLFLLLYVLLVGPLARIAVLYFSRYKKYILHFKTFRKEVRV